MNELSTVNEHQSSQTPTLRPMNMSDLVKVVKIIQAHDEDDGEAAEKQADGGAAPAKKAAPRKKAAPKSE